jgi:hypothetical protein
MNNTVGIFLMLLVATLMFHTAINYMARNIGDFEAVALPPKKSTATSPVYPNTTVDATSKDHWTLLHLATGKTHRINDPEKQKDLLRTLAWDIGFQRTKVITNGGETNPAGKVGLLDLGPTALEDSVTIPQASNFIRDSHQLGSLSNKAIAGWYNYRTRTHNIESKRNVYLAHASDGSYFKIRIINYYCRNHESDCRTETCPREEAACITLEYLPYNPVADDGRLASATTAGANDRP